MPIDWAATGAMLTGIGTLGGGAAIVVAALLGRQAVVDFKRQKQAEREIEHAEKALAAAYKLESAISAIRSPMTTGSESAEAQTELEDTDWFGSLDEARRSRTVQANVFYQRIRSFQPEYDAALAVLPFVKAYFGAEAEKALRDLIHCRHTVRVYADAYAKDEGRDRDFSRTIEGFVWEGALLEKGDPIDVRVKDDIRILESVLLPVIRSNDGKSAIKVVDEAPDAT